MTEFQALKAKVDFSEVDQARDAFKDLANEIPGASEAVDLFETAASSLKNPLVAVATVMATATAGAIALGFRAIEAADNLNDFAARTGKTIEYLQSLSDVAEKSGSNLGSMTDVLDQIQKKSVAGGEEGKKVAEAYKFLGLEARDASGNLKSAAQIGEEAANALDRLGYSTDAVAAFQDAMGSSALKNVPTLKNLNEELDKQYEYLASVGALMDSNLAEAADGYNDRMHDLGSVFKGLGNDVARMLLPALTGLASGMVNSATNSGLLSAGLEVVKGAVFVLTGAIKGILTALVALDNGFANVVQTIALGGKVIWAALSGDWDQIPQMWEDYKTRIVKTNVDAAETIKGIWSTVEAAPQSKDDFKNGQQGQGGKPYNPYKDKADKSDKPVTVKESDATKDLLALDQTIIKLQGDYAELFGIQQQTRVQMVQAAIDSGKYNAVLNEKKQIIKAAATEEQKAALLAKAAAEDELTIRNKVAKAELAAKDALDKAIESSRKAVTENRIRIQVLQRFGATQDDVNVALAQNNLLEAENALQTAISNGAAEEKLIKLRAEIALMRERKQAAEETKTDNDAEKQRRETFEYGWTTAFENYKKSATTAANMGQKAFESASKGMEDAFVSFAMTGKFSFADMTKSILSDLARIAAQKAIASAVGGFFANGGAFSGGVQFFANGGVVSSPTAFGMAGGIGVMGEAGPEAIMPLTRGNDGKLGVRAQGGSGGNVQVSNQITVSINNVDSTERVQEVQRAVRDTVEKVTKQTIANELRKGGILNPTR